jgi:hypothetical protein
MLGAHSKKPRVVRGSERLTTRLIELAGLVLAERECADYLFTDVHSSLLIICKLLICLISSFTASYCRSPSATLILGTDAGTGNEVKSWQLRSY